ncbi:MAG: DUF4442 domain-containing protein [Limnobacter sp.]|uniref:DUF4442 domain-containing protein n=1 Tax=Limnobacter sp. TaxID=2003368 RepID=UPI00391C115E
MKLFNKPAVNTVIQKTLKQLLLKPAVLKQVFNLYSPFRGAGVKVRQIASDYSEVFVEMPLTRRNRNFVGTQFGGSLYSMADPFFMIMLMQRLGSRYLVWDQAASIRFVAPGKGRVSARFKVGEEDIQNIAAQAASGNKVLYTFNAQICHDDGSVVAEVSKVLYVRLKPEFRPATVANPSAQEVVA